MKQFFVCLAGLLCLLPVSVLNAQDDVKLIKGDNLQVEGAVKHSHIDGVGYIDLGDWIPFEGSFYTDGGPDVKITLKRPKGAAANYPVSIMYRYLEEGSEKVRLVDENRHDDSFYGELPDNGDYYYWSDGWDCIVFQPGETEKTITFREVEPDNLGDDIYAYIEFGYANRTSIDYDLVQLHWNRTTAYVMPEKGDTLETTEVSLYSSDYMRTTPFKVGHWILGSYEIQSTNWDYKWNWTPVIRIGNDSYTTLSKGQTDYSTADLTTSTVTEKMYTLEQPGATTNGLFTYAYKLKENDLMSDEDGNCWANLGFTEPSGLTITNLKTQPSGIGGFTKTTFWPYEGFITTGMVQPRFGTVSLDKTVYTPGDVMTVTVPVPNWRLLNRIYKGADGWTTYVQLTTDGGATAAASNPTFDEATGSLIFRMNATTDNCPDKTTKYVELMLTGNLLPSNDNELWHDKPLPYMLPADAFFTYDVQGVLQNPVYTTQIDITGLPDDNKVTLVDKSVALQLTATTLPADGTFHGGKWTSSDTNVATVSNGGVVTFFNQGSVDITYTSNEAAYRSANNLPANDAVLKKTVTLRACGVLPENMEGYSYHDLGEKVVTFKPTLTVPQDGNPSGTPSRFWSVDYGKQATVTYTHQDAATYPAITQQLTMERGMSVTVPFDDKTFPRYVVSDDNDPSCVIEMHIPITDGLGDTEDYVITHRLYFDFPKASLLTNLAETSAIDTLADGSLRVHMHATGLDRQHGFEFGAWHSIFDQEVNGSLDYTIDTTWGLNIAAGTSLEDVVSQADAKGITITPQPDNRFVEADGYFTFRSKGGYDNMLYAYAKNANKFKSSNQTLRWTDEVADPNDLWFQIGSKYYQGDVDYKKDDREWVERLGDGTDINDLEEFLTGAKCVKYRMESPTNWGTYEVYVDDVLRYQPSVADAGKGVEVVYPLDDQKHIVSFRWPKVGVQRDLEYTGYYPNVQNLYLIKSIFASKFEDVKFTMLDEDSVETVVTHSTYSPFIYNANGKKLLKISLSRDDGTIMPVSIRDPKPMTVPRGSQVEVNPLTYSGLQVEQTANYYEAINRERLYVRVIDANTGNTITDNVRINACEWWDYKNTNPANETYSSTDADGLFNINGKYTTHEIVADGYWPVQVDRINVGDRCVSYNGKEVQQTGDKFIATVSLKPLSDPTGYIQQLQVEEQDPSDSTKTFLRDLTYDKNTVITYDGSLDPGRMMVMKMYIDGSMDLQVSDTWANGTPSRANQFYLISDSAFSKVKNAYRKISLRVYRFGNGYSSTYLFHKSRYPNYENTYVYVYGTLQDFLNPEVQGPTRLKCEFDPTFSENFLTMHNIDEDVQDLANDMDVEVNLANINVKEGSSDQDMGKMQNNFDNFSLTLPSTMDFTLAVTKRNNDFLLRGIYSKSFLPDGGVSDMMSKTDFLSDVDAAFYECQRAAGQSDQEYDPDERMLTFPSAFAGIRAWVEGRVGYMPQKKSYGFELSGLGVKAELSGRVAARVNCGFAAFGATLSGEMSMTGYLQRPSNEELEAAGVLDKNKANLEVGMDFLTSLKASAFMEAGVDIFIASAKVGIKGSAWAEFEAGVKHRFWHPTQKTQYGIRFEVGAKMAAYAKAHFLCWSVYKEKTLLELVGEWYKPNNSVNPLWEDESDKVRRRTLASYYKPLEPRRMPANTVYLAKDVDTYTTPYLINEGKSLLFLNRKDINAYNDDVISVNTDGKEDYNFGNTDTSYPMPVSAPNAAVKGDKMVASYVKSYALTHNDLDDDGNPKDMGGMLNGQYVWARIYDGSQWKDDDWVGHGYQPRAAVSANGDAAVMWKTYDELKDGTDAEGETVQTATGELQLALRRKDDTSFCDGFSLGEDIDSTQVNDYVMAMNDTVPLILTSVTSLKDNQARIGFIQVQKDDDGNWEGKPAVTTFAGTMPQIVAIGSGKYIGSALVKGSNSKGDIQLLGLTQNGSVSDMGTLGLNNRDIIDYRLLAPTTATSVDGMVAMWREAQSDNDGSVYNKLYASRIQLDSDGRVFPSCPVLVLSQDNEIDISAYDAYINGNQVKVAINVSDQETDGAHIIEKDIEFTNNVKCEYAAINGEVNAGQKIPLRFVVFNEGYQPIDYVDLTINDQTTTHTVSIMPGHSAEITDNAPAGTDLSQPLSFTVSPTYSETIRSTRSHDVARRAQARRKVVSTTNSLTAAVVDMGVEVYSFHTDKDKTTVVGKLSNNSPYAMNSGYKVRAGLYEDPMGINLAKGCYKQTFSQSMLCRNSDNLDKVVTLTMDNITEASNYYLVIETLDANGNVVYDQNSDNNAAMLTLYPDPEVVGTEKQNVTQVVPLQKGWNWSSLYVKADDMSASTLLSGINDHAQEVRTMTTYTQNSGDGWQGTLSELATGEMYKVSTDAATNWAVEGSTVESGDYPQKVGQNWNWLGVSTSYNMTLDDAFVQLNPAEGDVVKSQSAFAVYEDGSWHGSLNSIEPGYGYMYNSKTTSVKEFAYPSQTALTGAVKAHRARRSVMGAVVTDFDGTSYYQYPGNMTVAGQLMDGSEPMANTQVAVYVGSECREVQVSDADGRVWLTIPGDGKGQVQFRVMKESGLTEADCTIPFVTDACYGTYGVPYLIQFDDATALSPIANEMGKQADTNPSYNVGGIRVNPSQYRGVVVSKDGKRVANAKR